MEIEFDPAKDAVNIDKHGISLSRATDLHLLADCLPMWTMIALSSRGFVSMA
ncbi:MAG: hypothetical protein JHD32_03190 [Sphingobium sp.]|nr:hypothetical protein [Sphingobium sp.]